MLKLLLIVLCIILCLLSCNHEPVENTETDSPAVETIETEPETEEVPIAYVSWSDFVKYNGQRYEGDWNETTVLSENIVKLLGYIENSVPDEIENFSEYTVPDNASPHRPVGTPFYSVKDNENAIAVYDNDKNSYYLYQLKE